MPKNKKPPPEPDGDVPMWFMTYSDVITLMMTFFILLLTFATSEPERFEQMKVSLFGASGANGLVGQPPEGVEKDAWVMRTRPRSARLTNRGSEMPPIDRQATKDALGKELAGLEEDERRQVEDTMTFNVPGTAIGSIKGELYDYGQHYLKILARIMKNRAYEMTMEISSDNQMERVLSCIEYMYHIQRLRPDRLMISRQNFGDLPANMIRIRLVYFEGKSNGQTRTQAAK